MSSEGFLSFTDLLLRGGVCLVLLLLAALLVRDYGRLIAARLGAFFALGAAAYCLCSAAGFHTHTAWWKIPILALATGNNVVFWLFACALFDDAFRPRWWQAGLWVFSVAVGVLEGVMVEPQDPALAALVRSFLSLEALGFAMLATGQTLASWPGDLVERRRRLRLFIVAASTGYIGLTALATLLGAPRAAPVAVSVVEACGLAVIASTVAWSLLRVAGEDSLFAPTAGEAVSVTAPAAARLARLTPADQSHLAALEQAMTVERVYRQDGLTIGRLALRQGLPEYRLRRLINQGLGYRNFNSFLNRYRIAEAKAALADPGQSAVPILTIALDAGFSSLGPFNRAFKAETGMTPSEYRRATGGGPATAPADSGIGQRVSESAGHPSSSARRTTARAS